MSDAHRLRILFWNTINTSEVKDVVPLGFVSAVRVKVLSDAIHTPRGFGNEKVVAIKILTYW